MHVAIVGRTARSLDNIAGVKAYAFSALCEVEQRVWDLLALTRDAAAAPFSGQLSTRNLLLPGDSEPKLALRLHASQVVSYGFSPRDTLTLSSVTGTERLLCLQRSLLTLGGRVLEPQELPLSPALSALSGEDALLVAGVMCFQDLPFF